MDSHPPFCYALLNTKNTTGVNMMGLVKAANLSQWTEEEIELAAEMHDEVCVDGCDYGPFMSMFEPEGWLELAREKLNDRPQKEVLF